MATDSDDEYEDDGINVPLLLGIGGFFVLTWGMFLYGFSKLVARPDQASSALPAGVNGMAPVQIFINGNGTAPQLGMPQAAMYAPPMQLMGPTGVDPKEHIQPVMQTPVAPTIFGTGVVKQSKMNTFTLSATNISRVMTASSGKHWRATITCLGPPGAAAFVSNQQTNLAFQSESLTIPAGNVPATVEVSPGEVLYAVGSVDGVQVSVFANEEAA